MQQIVEPCNSLQEGVREANWSWEFKGRLDKYMKKKFIDVSYI